MSVKSFFKNLFHSSGSNSLVHTAIDDFKAEVTMHFPTVVHAFGQAFDELENDTTVTGFARMEKAVLMVLPQLPAIAAELAHVTDKTLWLSVGQDLFAKAVPAVEKAAVDALAGLNAKAVAP